MSCENYCVITSDPVVAGYANERGAKFRMDALVKGEEEELLRAVGHVCRADAGPARGARHSQAPVPPAAALALSDSQEGCGERGACSVPRAAPCSGTGELPAAIGARAPVAGGRCAVCCGRDGDAQGREQRAPVQRVELAVSWPVLCSACEDRGCSLHPAMCWLQVDLWARSVN